MDGFRTDLESGHLIHHPVQIAIVILLHRSKPHMINIRAPLLLLLLCIGLLSMETLAGPSV